MNWILCEGQEPRIFHFNFRWLWLGKEWRLSTTHIRAEISIYVKDVSYLYVFPWWLIVGIRQHCNPSPFFNSTNVYGKKTQNNNNKKYIHESGEWKTIVEAECAEKSRNGEWRKKMKKARKRKGREASSKHFSHHNTHPCRWVLLSTFRARRFQTLIRTTWW